MDPRSRPQRPANRAACGWRRVRWTCPPLRSGFYHSTRSFGKGEVVSSILTGGTSKISMFERDHRVLTKQRLAARGWNATRTCEIRAFRSRLFLGILIVIRPNKARNDGERAQEKVRAYDDPHGTAVRRPCALLLCAGSEENRARPSLPMPG